MQVKVCARKSVIHEIQYRKKTDRVATISRPFLPSELGLRPSELGLRPPRRVKTRSHSVP